MASEHGYSNHRGFPLINLIISDRETSFKHISERSIIMKCPVCGKTVKWFSGGYEIFCSKECEEQFKNEFQTLVDNLDTEIPEELFEDKDE